MTKKRKAIGVTGSKPSKARRKANKTVGQKQKSLCPPDNDPARVREFKAKLMRIKGGRGGVTEKRDAGFKSGFSMGLTRYLVARLVTEFIGAHERGRTSVINVGRIG